MQPDLLFASKSQIWIIAQKRRVTVAFGADANYQARERLVLAFVSFLAFWFFDVFYSRFLYYST